MKIAITGTIGSGKTVACEYLRLKGYDVFDCDKENALLLQKDQEGYNALKKIFPQCFINEELDKKMLADIVFNDPEQKKILEMIMHPLILNRLQQRKDNPLFAEVPLLFEADWDRYFDHNLLLITDMDIVVKRLEERGLSRKEANDRVNAQMSVEEKIKRADKIIYNNGSLNELYENIDMWLDEII